MALPQSWYDDRVTATQNAIVACEAAIVAVLGGSQSYTLDTGQTRQVVTKANLSDIRLMLRELKAQLKEQIQEADDAAANATPGSSVTRVIPGF